MSFYEDPYCVLPGSGSSIAVSSTMEKALQEMLRNAEWHDEEWQAEARKRTTEERTRHEAPSKSEMAEAELHRAQASSKQQGITATTTNLLPLLDVDTARVENEAMTILQRGRSFDRSVHDMVLLVDGNAGSAFERVSAMTIVCASLAHSLPTINASAITYFCGLHTDPADTLCGPCGILRATLAQLMETQDIRLSFINSEEYNELQRFNLRRPCIVLGVVMEKLPTRAVVFCVIDGISLYEKDEWLEGTCYTLRMIGDLARDPEVSAIFKLLVTSPLASRHVAKYVQDEDHVVLPRDQYGGDGSSIRNERLMMQSRSMAGKGKVVGEIDQISFDETPFIVNFDEGALRKIVLRSITDNSRCNRGGWQIRIRSLRDLMKA